MITVRMIDEAHSQDIHIKNDPFLLRGRMIPSYTDGKWGYSILEFPAEEITQMCFPDETYDYEAMKSDSVFLGAYDGKQCVGLLILQEHWNRYLYVPDLKVCAAYRGQGIGRRLVEKACEIALSRNCRGIWLQGQDNNLDACLFYLHTGFRIGGLDTEVYRGTSQEGKADILFYRDSK